MQKVYYGDERYFVRLRVSFDIDRSPDRGLGIDVNRTFIPEGDIEQPLERKDNGR